jgi:hypothetical protein
MTSRSDDSQKVGIFLLRGPWDNHRSHGHFHFSYAQMTDGIKVTYVEPTKVSDRYILKGHPREDSIWSFRVVK